MEIPADVKARDMKTEFFEQATIEELQDELQVWLASRTEELIIGVEFQVALGGTDPDSYSAFVIYTE